MTSNQISPRVAEVPFDSDRKRMTTVHKVERASLEKLKLEAGALQSVQTPFVAFTKGSRRMGCWIFRPTSG